MLFFLFEVVQPRGHQLSRMGAGRGTSKKYSYSAVSYARYEPWIGRDLGDPLAQRSIQVYGNSYLSSDAEHFCI